jgi:2-polyprenyl-3-methyl-5-hydroxy-6-metoxy-1,4-benzoquinol methylase
VCDKEDFVQIKKNDGFQVLKCNECDSIYSNFVTFSEEGLQNQSKAHLGDYIEVRFFNMPSFLVNRYVSKLVANFDFKYLEKHVDLQTIKNALDIGAKFGYLVRNLLGCGINVLGIEAMKYPFSVVEDKIVHQYFAESYDSRGKKFGLIVKGDILHVMPNSLAVLKKAIQLLEDNGYLLITSFNPNSDKVQEIIERHGVGSILYLSRKGYEKICSDNNCRVMDFRCWAPKTFVIKITLMNKIRAGMSILKTLMRCESGFEENVNGIRSSVLIKKLNNK